MKLHWMIGLLACAAAFSAQAQYKYIGPDGRVVYSDQPPPPSAKGVKKENLPGQSSGASELPFAVQKAVQTYPVTLYTAPNCGAPCSEGKAYLNQRGVPFTEKTVKTPEDAVEFKKSMNTEQLPVLVVGSNKQTQWDKDAWTAALNSAGYPADNQLPRSYKNPAPVGVAPTAPAQSTAQNAPPAAPAAPSDSAPAAPAGGDKPNWFKGF
jgi:glutaredoxin